MYLYLTRLEAAADSTACSWYKGSKTSNQQYHGDVSTVPASHAHISEPKLSEFDMSSCAYIVLSLDIDDVLYMCVQRHCDTAAFSEPRCIA